MEFVTNKMPLIEQDGSATIISKRQYLSGILAIIINVLVVFQAMPGQHFKIDHDRFNPNRRLFMTGFPLHSTLI